MIQQWADAATQNCVWLFQTRQQIISNRSELDGMDRRDVIEGCLNHTKSIRAVIEYVNEYEKEGIYPECLVQLEEDTWHTEAVFLLREEARAYGQSRPYAWGKENDGWQIYGVPLRGISVSLLAGAGVNQEFIDSNLKK
jgi:hypothetical protein